MIELVNTFIVGTDQAELEALQVLLLEFSPNFTFSITENDVEPVTYKLLVEMQEGSNIPDMTFFLDFLSSKIEQVNQQS